MKLKTLTLLVILLAPVFSSCISTKSELRCELDKETEANRYRALKICQEHLRKSEWDECHSIANQIFPGSQCTRSFEYMKDASYIPCSTAKKGTSEYTACQEERDKYNDYDKEVQPVQPD